MTRAHIRWCNMFSALVCAVCAAVFALVVPGTLARCAEVGFGSAALSVALGVLLALMLALLVWYLFGRIEAHAEDHVWQRCLTGALFVLMALVMVCMLVFIAPRPMTDSFEDIDAAMYLVQNGTMDDGFGYIDHVAAYANNQLFVVLLAGLFRMLLACGVSDVLVPLMALNVGAILAGEFVFWLVVRDCHGTTSANRFLALCALNPLYYGLACWLYTMTYSLPIMAGIVYAALRIWRAPTRRVAVGWGALAGVLVAVGYGLRATSVFPFVAMIVVGVGALAVSRAQARDRLACAALALVLCAGGTHALVGRVQAQAFAGLEDRAYPVSYWLAMGSNGTGTLADRDDYMDVAGDVARTPQQRSAALWERTRANYRELGVAGTLGLWAEKTLLTWSDGYSWFNVRTRIGRHRGPLFEFTGGGHSELFMLYSHAFRLLTLVGVVLACAFCLHRRAFALIDVVWMVTLLGGVVFYCLWEAKNIYSGPFVLVMLALCEQGLTQVVASWASLRERRLSPASERAVRYCRVALVAFAVVVCACLVPPLREVGPRSYVRLGTTSSNKFSQNVSFDVARQSFFMAEKFNCLALGVREDEPAAVAHAGGEGTATTSRYKATLLNEGGEALASWEYGTDDMREAAYTSYVLLPLPDEVPPQEGAYYTLEVRKLEPAAADLCLRTTPTCYLDYYRGEALVDDEGPLVGDLMLDVRYDTEEPYLF